MSYRLLALDLDGTLLSDEKTVSPRNREAIKAAAAKGVKVVIASGRIVPEALVSVEGVEGLSLVSACNGALAYDLEGAQVLSLRPIPEGLCQQVVQVLEEAEVFFMVYSEKIVYLNRHVLKAHKSLARHLEGSQCEHHFVEDFAADPRLAKAAKLKVYTSITDPALLAEVRARLSALGGLEISSSHPMNLEVTAAGVDKGSGLVEIGKLYGITPAEMMAIGDSENDLAMLATVGLPVAMGNATPAVLSMAKDRTLTNDQDGVAAAIEKHLL